MTKLTLTQTRQIITILNDVMQYTNARRAIFVHAFGVGHELKYLLDYQGNTADFTANMLQELVDYGEIETGKSALLALLEAIEESGRVGVDKQAQIKNILTQLTVVKPSFYPHVEQLLKQFSKARETKAWSIMIDCGEKLLQNGVDDDNIRKGVAFAYRRRGKQANSKDYEAKIKDYTRAIELNPLDPITYNNRGTCYRNQGKYEEALSDYAQAIELKENYARVYWNRSFIYRDKGNNRAETADIERAADLGHTNAKKKLGRK